MAYTAEERETFFNFDDSSDICYIYTCSKTLMNKLDKLCKKFPNEYKLEKQDDCSKSYITKKKYVSIRTPKIMSASHLAKLQENAKKMHDK